MRRFWAHLLIAFTCIVGVFAAFPSCVKSLNTNGDYQTRRSFTFQLSEKKLEDGSVVKSLTDEGKNPEAPYAAKNMAKLMEERLIQSEITSYEISTEGNDIINVSFRAPSNSSTEYAQVTTYLGFSGSFALMNRDENSEPIPAKDFLNGSAYLLSDVNQYPTIVIPVKTDSEAYKNLVDWARNEENQVESEADEEGNTTKSAPVYIIYNYVFGDTYKTLTETNRFNEKILITLDALTDDSLYYDDNHNSYSQVCGYSDENGNGYADANEVAAAYSQAKFLNNLFNADALDYDVEVIKGMNEDTKVWVPAKVESVFSYGSIAWTGTLTALVAAIVIITLILVVIYRLGALSIVTTSLVSAFLAFMFMVLAGMEYNVLAVVGVILIAILGLASGVIYFSKLKGEAYRGRTLKKANSEAARKSLLPIIDIHFVSVVVGLMLYLLGGASLHTFAAVLILGSLSGVIINVLGLRALAWLVTNTTAFTGKYSLFAIEEEKVPNHMADEKQTYFGPYEGKDLTKNKKPFGIAAIALFVISFIGIGLMGGLNGGDLFKNASSANTGSNIYIVDTIKVISDEKSKMNKDSVTAMLENIKVYQNAGEEVTFDPADTHKTLASYVSNIDEFVTSESETVEGTTTNYSHYYFVANLTSILDGEKMHAKIKDYVAPEMTLNEALAVYFEADDSYSSSFSTTMSLKTGATYSNYQSARWEKVTLATFIAILIITVYLLIRYRLSRGLASLIFPVAISAITLGFFLLPGLFGLALPSEIVILVPFATFMSYIFMILIANKERELVIEDRTRDASFDHRKELSIKALSMAYTYIMYLSAIVVFLPIVFFGFGPSVYSYVYLALLLALALAILIISSTYIPLSNLLYKLFMNIDLSSLKPKKSKKKQVAKQKSAEPEEAIFIGIND